MCQMLSRRDMGDDGYVKPDICSFNHYHLLLLILYPEMPIWEASCSSTFSLNSPCCSRDMFDTSSLIRGSVWGRINVLLPELKPIVLHLSRLFPDKPLIRNLKVRRDML